VRWCGRVDDALRRVGEATASRVKSSRGGALRRIGKVSELRLPHDERGGVLERVAELEAEDGKLGEGGVARHEVGLRRVDVLERRVPVGGGKMG
jgi:hypothetical protein